jgi:hypothetical protein
MFHDDPTVNAILTSVNTALGEYVAEHTRVADLVADVKLSAWIESLVAEEYEGEVLDDAGEFIDDATAEQLAGFIPVLSELLTEAKQALRKFYYAKHDHADVQNVDLEAMRDKAKRTFDNSMGLAELGTIPGLTPELVRGLPNVKFGKRQVKNTPGLFNEVLDLPRAPQKAHKTHTGIRSNNGRMKVTIDGQVPDDHPMNIGDALKRYGFKNVTEARELFQNYTDRSGKTIFERDGKAYGLTMVK